MPLTIHPLVTAELAAEAGRLTYLRNYGRQLWIPSPFFVILGGREPILVDTSGSAEVMGALRSEPVRPVMDFDAALAKVGLTPRDVRTVVHTHLMYDHCANSNLLPGARFIVQQAELDFALNPHPMMAGAYQRHLFENLNFETIQGDVDLAPGVRLLFTPGHTPGTQSVAVETGAGLAVITGFCCLAESFSPQSSPAWKGAATPLVIPSGIHTDMVQAYDSMMRVKEMADIIIPFHEPSIAAKACIPEPMEAGRS